MNSERTPWSFWMAIAGVLATLLFAWQAAAASSGTTGFGRTFVGWIPRAYAIEAVTMSAGTRQVSVSAGRAIAACIVGAVAQVALMLSVIGAAMMLSPRSS